MPDALSSRSAWMQAIPPAMHTSAGTIARHATTLAASPSLSDHWLPSSASPATVGTAVAAAVATPTPLPATNSPDFTAFDAPSDLQDLPDASAGLLPPPEGRYPDRATLIAAVQAHAKAHGYNVVVKSSSTPSDKKPGRTAKVWLRCDRGGQYRPRNGLTEQTRKRKRTSRLMDCPFMLVAAGHPGIWTLTVLNPAHNHGPVADKPRAGSIAASSSAGVTAPAPGIGSAPRKPRRGQMRADPYDWPHDGSFTPFATALLVIDMQRDACDPAGYYARAGLAAGARAAAALARPLQRLLRAFRAASFPVLYTREGHASGLPSLARRDAFRVQAGHARLVAGAPGPLGRFAVRGENGHEVIEELRPRGDEPVIDRAGKSAFARSELELLLRNRGVRNLVVVGVSVEAAVAATVRDASDRGFECIVLADGTASTYTGHQRRVTETLEALKLDGGMFACVGTVDDAIQAAEAFGTAAAKKMNAASHAANGAAGASQQVRGPERPSPLAHPQRNASQPQQQPQQPQLPSPSFVPPLHTPQMTVPHFTPSQVTAAAHGMADIPCLPTQMVPTPAQLASRPLPPPQQQPPMAHGHMGGAQLGRMGP